MATSWSAGTATNSAWAEPLVGPADDRRAHALDGHAVSELGDHPGEVRPLARRERCRKLLVELAFPYGDLAGVDPGRDHANQNLTGTGRGPFNLGDLENINIPVVFKAYCFWHLLPPANSLLEIELPAKQGAVTPVATAASFRTHGIHVHKVALHRCHTSRKLCFFGILRQGMEFSAVVS